MLIFFSLGSLTVIRELIVTGYPATYKNFRKLPCEAHK